MSPLPGLAIYQPHRLDPDTFLVAFVARTDLADFLLDKLRMAPADGIADHQLIVGQRGMGKTSLLRRLAIGITRDKELSRRYIPLTFREEQYNVRSLARLWRNCAELLAEWCEAEGRTAIAAELDRAMGKPEWHDPRAAAEAFLATAKSLGGRPVLFIDNLDLILDALPPDEHWGLRHTLQAPSGPILYGAATQYSSARAATAAAPFTSSSTRICCTRCPKPSCCAACARSPIPAGRRASPCAISWRANPNGCAPSTPSPAAIRGCWRLSTNCWNAPRATPCSPTSKCCWTS